MNDDPDLENTKGSEAGGIKVGDVSNAAGVIIGENIKTGDININVYETAKNYGLTLLTPNYFKDNQQTDQNFNSWKKGFLLKLPSVRERREFRREQILKNIKDKLENIENNHRLLLLGRPGSSKSTILMEIICEYFEDKYQIMYNWGNTKIENSEEVVNFIGQLLNNGNKILIAVDNVHLESVVSIFPIIDALSTHNKGANLRIILTARIPDYNRFLDEGLSKLTPDIRSSLREIDKENFRYPLPNFSREEIKEFIKKYQNEPQVREFISKHSTSSIVNEQTYEELARIVNDQTKGDPIKIKFLVFGKGLAIDAQTSYDDYLHGNEMKIRTTMFCSLLNLLNRVSLKEALEVNDLLKPAQELVEEFILEVSGAGYHTKHPSWDLELFSYILNVTSIRTLQVRKEYLKNALNLLFKYEDEILTSSIISVVFDMTTIVTEEGKKIPIDVIDDVVVFPKYLSDKSMFNLYCFDIARCYFELANYQKALDNILKAIDIDNANGHVWNNKGLVLDKLGRYEEGIAAYEKALELDPKLVNTWFNKGITLGNLGRYEEAIVAYEKALELDPKLPKAWYNNGIVLANLGRNEDANESFEKALELDPKLPNAWYNRGVALGKLARYGDATVAYEKALEQDPKYVNAWYNKGLTLIKLTRYEEAIVSFERALEVDPKLPNAWYNKGVILGKLGRYEDAIVAYKKTLEVDPKYVSASYNIGIALGNLGKHEEAIVAYKKTLEVDPKYVSAWFSKGIALGNLGKHEEAIIPFEKATELDPKYVDAWYNRGVALGKLGRYEDANVSFEKALELDPKYVDAWYAKARCLVRENMIKDCLDHLEKAIKLGGEEYVNKAKEDEDFQAIKNNKRFMKLVDL